MINVYVIQVLLILFFGLVFKENKKRFLISAFLVLFVLMAFRNAKAIGYDSSSSYYIEFEGIDTIALSWPNPGLSLIMKIIQYLKGDYQWVIIITAVVVCYAYCKLLIKYSENGFISVMWFMGMLFYTFLFSALKQAWAMAFLCFAFDAIFEKRPIRFLFLVGLAVLFHFPALVFLPAYWIARLKINRSFPILMLSILTFVFVFRAQILNLMTSAYSKGSHEYSASSSFFGTKFVLMILILIYALYKYYLLDEDNSVFRALLYFMGIAAVIQTFCIYSNVFERLADFYYQFSIVFMPFILKRKTSKSKAYEKNASLRSSDISGTVSSKTLERISNYSIEDIDINTIFAVIITSFSVWRYLSFVINDIYFSPFNFFW